MLIETYMLALAKMTAVNIVKIQFAEDNYGIYMKILYLSNKV